MDKETQLIVVFQHMRQVHTSLKDCLLSVNMTTGTAAPSGRAGLVMMRDFSWKFKRQHFLEIT